MNFVQDTMGRFAPVHFPRLTRQIRASPDFHVAQDAPEFEYPGFPQAKDPDVCFACPDLSIDAAARPTSPARLRLDRSRPAEKNLAEGVENATTVRIRDGTTEIVDGPFAETKEQLGGYYLLDCGDLDEALGYAARIPTATYGSIEVRPIMVFS